MCMRRFYILAILVCCCACAVAGRLTAQVIPLASGNEWVYQDSELRDTVVVRLVGNGPATLLCGRTLQRQGAWFDTGGYIYMPMNGGLMVGRSKPAEKAAFATEPLFFIGDASMLRDKRVCEGNYVLIGTDRVETPAGTFDDCLIFDDLNVHRLCIKPGIGIVREERYRGREHGAAAGERVVVSSRVLVRYGIAGQEGTGR